MRRLCLLLSPRIWSFRNVLSHASQKGRKRTLIMVLVGLAFWALLFGLSFRVLKYFQSVEVIGDLLAHHLLGMILMVFFSLLVFSHIITALSNLYLSSDLELCHACPARLEEVFLSRAVYTLIDSSWMVIVFGLPVMMAYGFVFKPGFGFYFSLSHMGLGLALIAGGIGILTTMILVRIFPAQRTRDVIMLLGVCGLGALYMMFRLLRPERLVDPDAFFSIAQYMAALQGPDSPYLPTHWMTETLWAYLSRSPVKDVFFQSSLLWSTAGAITVITVWVAEAIYFSGFSKSQEAKRRRAGKRLLDFFVALIRRPFRSELGAIIDKDLRTFFRDNAQWSQLLLLAALVVVYVYNFSVLPLDKSPIRMDFLQNEIAFLNVGLAGFVLSAVSVRFIFPAVSSEGAAFWIVQASPVPLKRFLWTKFALYLFPMLVLGEVLIILTNHLLEVTPFMMALSSVTMLLAVFGIVALGVGMGAMYPNFNHQNIAQVATGFGGLMFMIFSAAFVALIVALEAAPVYVLVMAELRGVPVAGWQWVLIVLSFSAVLFIMAAAVYQPMKMGLKALSGHE
jgi:ABC-2 type transport system permease protein